MWKTQVLLYNAYIGLYLFSSVLNRMASPGHHILHFSPFQIPSLSVCWASNIYQFCLLLFPFSPKYPALPHFGPLQLTSNPLGFPLWMWARASAVWRSWACAILSLWQQHRCCLALLSFMKSKCSPAPFRSSPWAGGTHTCTDNSTITNRVSGDDTIQSQVMDTNSDPKSEIW